ncbi:hypothetical protein RHGRI_017263 [Rhododendron griersonianum]|uniref:Magnesium transporter CorA-like family protein n=1 Tax=Rhododendron griersonianum TaxID=479676 RepID=A0AAV6JXI5_9ERIC|nr:hypothetical protein RHGRI_017263 [Rhododendron griersonianum]KAG5544760.1 hypothetical protein RHGRI_017263 [Rhododendron griersonianum]
MSSRALGDGNSAPISNNPKKQGNRLQQSNSDVILGSELWTDGLICAFEFVRVRKKTIWPKSGSIEVAKKQTHGSIPGNSLPTQVYENNFLDSSPTKEPGASEMDTLDGNSYKQDYHLWCSQVRERSPGSYWVPIGWARITELVQIVQVDAGWASQPAELTEEEDDVTVADVAAPYWERPKGPTWWCHGMAGHPFVDTWLSNAQWLHPAISVALRDESKLISERMKHLLYEVPVRVSGGLLFELLGQSAGDPFVGEDDVPVVLRSWQAQNFLVSALHVKGSASNINVLGIAEVQVRTCSATCLFFVPLFLSTANSVSVFMLRLFSSSCHFLFASDQEMLAAGGYNVPQTIHEVIALLACRLAKWDDRLFRKSIFGEADEVELKFMNRRTHEDMQLFSVILNQEIRRLSTQVIRVKWSLHAREEIVFELVQHLRGNAARNLLEGIRKSTREMIDEQEAVRGRLFTIQDVIQGTVRALLQDQSLRVSHNLGVFGGCGLVLSIVTGLFGINVDGIPGTENSPYAFALFSGLLIFLGIVLIAIGLLYLGLRKPVTEDLVEVRKLELQELVKMFQQEAEAHAQVRKTTRTKMPSAAAGILPDGSGYVLIG